MLSMDMCHDIRTRYTVQGQSVSQIARDLNLDWKTVNKYAHKEDWNLPAPKVVGHRSKLDDYTAVIDTLLEEDLKHMRKQRHTAKRIHERLQHEHHADVSYSLVSAYVQKKKKALQTDSHKGYLPLTHFAGEAQADFGTAEYYYNGDLRTGKYLVLSFPYSNAGLIQFHPGENMECLLESLVAIFEHIGGVPREIWFDNASTIVTKIEENRDRILTQRFQAFQTHYGFRAIFMNKGKGNEKGNVENKVGYDRRNFLVPVPKISSFKEYNKELLAKSDQDMERPHYLHNETTIASLFQEDKDHLLALPDKAFQTAAYEVHKTDKYGRVTLHPGNNATHIYSASPDYPEEKVYVKKTAETITILTPDMKEIVTHLRRYVETDETIMDWVPYMKYICQRPRSYRNTIYPFMPGSLRDFCDSCNDSERRQALKVLVSLTEKYGFQKAMTTLDEAIARNIKDPDSIMNIFRMTFMDVPTMQPLEPCPEIPSLETVPSGMKAYEDMLGSLQNGGVTNG